MSAGNWTRRRSGYPSWTRSSATGCALIRLAGSLLIEQNDEWLVARRYLSVESLALVLEDEGETPQDDEKEAVRELTAS